MKNLLLIVLGVLFFPRLDGQNAFQFLASKNSSKDSILYVDPVGQNLTASSMLFLSPVWQDAKDNNALNPYGLRFDGTRWNIYNLSGKTFFPVNAQMRFNVLAYPSPADSTFIHTVSNSNRNGYYTVLNHPKLNGNPNAVLLVTQRYDKVKNDHQVGVWYRNGHWVIFNQDRVTLPLGSQFNVLVSKPGVKLNPKAGNTLATTHIHGNSRLLGGGLNAYTKLDHPQLNLNESSIIFATQFWMGAYNPRAYMLWYDHPNDALNYANGYWMIYNSQNEALPLNSAFHLIAFNKTTTNQAGPLPAICFDRLPSKADFDKNKKAAPGQYWSVGQTLSIFVSNTYPKARERVIQFIKEWQPYVNLKFEFIEKEPASISIAFNTNQGDWSWSGTACSLNSPSMNLGSVTDATNEQTLKPLVLRLFAQALGLSHEHHHPSSGIPWDREALYRFFGDAPNYWKPEEIDWNVLTRYERNQFPFTLSDPKSILRYGIPNELSIGDFSISTNDKITDSDIRNMRSIYPPASAATTPKLQLFISTYTQDLGPSSQVRLGIRIQNQVDLLEFPLNRGEEWTFGDRRTIDIPLPAATKMEDLRGCILYFWGGLPYSHAPSDTWNFNILQLFWVDATGKSTQLVSLRGVPLATLQNDGTNIYSIYSNNK